MASSKGKGQFSSDIENKWKRENSDMPNSWPDQSQAFGNDRGIQTRADSSPRKFHWFPSHAGQGASGESALVFHPDFLLSMQNCSPKISPTSTTGLHTHWLFCLKYPPLSCLLRHRTREGTLLCAITVFVQYLPPSFPPFLCFSDSAHKGSPTRSASILHSFLRKPCPESVRTGRPSQGLPASAALPLQPSWSTSYSTLGSVFIHLLSLKDLVQRGPQEMLKAQV